MLCQFHIVYLINLQHMFFTLGAFSFAGHSFQGRSSFSSVVIAARDEQRKIPLTGTHLFADSHPLFYIS